MNITDAEYKRLIHENKELKEDHARLLGTIRLIGDERDSLKAQRDQLREALSFYVSICGNTANNVCKQTAGEMYDMARTALEVTKEPQA